jgi:hypothetical protein
VKFPPITAPLTLYTKKKNWKIFKTFFLSVAAGPPCGAVRGVSSLRHCMAGDPPPPAQGGGGDITPPLLRSMAGFYCVLLLYGTDDLSSGREPRLLWSHRRSPLCGRLSASASAPYSANGMDLGCGGDVYVYVFAPDTSQLRGRHWLRPGGMATVIRQVLAPSRLGLAPTANSPGSGSQTSLFFASAMSTWTSFKPWMVGSLPFAKFITPADCSSWELRLRLHPDLGRTDVAMVPGGRPHRRRGFLSALLVHVDSSSSFCLGDTGAIRPGF